MCLVCRATYFRAARDRKFPEPVFKAAASLVVALLSITASGMRRIVAAEALGWVAWKLPSG